MPQRLADALRAKPLDENSDGSEAALFAPRAQFLWQGLMQLNATLGVPRQPTPEGDTSAGDEPWQNHEAQLDELKTSSEHSDLLHDQRPPQLPTSQQLVQTHLQQRNRQGLPAGTPPHVGGPAAGQARAETVPEPKHSREPADSHLFGDEALAAALGVAKGRAAAAALAALADHLSRQVGGGGGCQSSVCSALRRIFPDAVGLRWAAAAADCTCANRSSEYHLHAAFRQAGAFPEGSMPYDGLDTIFVNYRIPEVPDRTHCDTPNRGFKVHCAASIWKNLLARLLLHIAGVLQSPARILLQ